MARIRTVKSSRSIRRTALIIGEGDAEYYFLAHIRDLYTNDRNGCCLKIKNAHGLGAANVIDKVIRASRNTEYDSRAALLDTDTPCWEAARSRARRESIVVFQQSPCLEAWLLEVVGHGRVGTTAAQKVAFKKHFKCEAHELSLPRHFPLQILNDARPRVSVLDQLLAFIGV